MIKIEVVSILGVPTQKPLSAQFSSDGGSIGRAPTNLLVLDDTERTVSRVHAQVVFRKGSFFIIDKGSNPLSCNGSMVGANNEAPIKNGDKLQIGSFQLLVKDAGGAKNSPVLSDDETMAHKKPERSVFGGADDPFADLLAGLAPAPAPVPAATQAAPSPAAPQMFPDPMGFDRTSAKAGKADPFDDLLGFGSGGGSAPSAQASAGSPFDALPSGGSSSLDDLFGLGPSTAGNDPFAQSPLASPMFQPNTASSADPLQALMGDAPKATAASRADHVPALQQAYTLPAAVDAKPKAPPVQSPPPVQRPPTAQAAPYAPPAPTPKAAPRAPGAAGGASDSELLAAFLRGVKSKHQMPTELTPELMERIGAMLHTATNGTLQLLLSRQEFKKVLQAEVTMIAMVANNPLKFSPNAEVALAHMLGPKVRGFMGAEEAMTNAYADLRAHQFGVMVGMRAALAHVLELFTPETLEKRLTEKSKLDEFFSASRKAKLWDQFCKLYKGIATEAEDDFHTLFGKAFSKAYDEQMARFKSDN